MRRLLLPLLLGVVPFAGPPAAQQWADGHDLPLIQRAVAQRTARDSDTLLTSWQARAHGIVRMLSVVDQDGHPVERLIKLDELMVEVYGEIPSRSKQVITAWRDTSYLPNRVRYHRDHLGIVANDFGGTIRLGDGDEVRDLIHPLSEAGLGYYRFAIRDTLTLRSSLGTVRVTAVSVRPADPELAGVVGTLYLDIDRAALARFQFTFTPAAYRDRTVRDISVMLESALQQQARWLPWRQSIVIRRENPVIAMPTHDIIRADWELDDYVLGEKHPPAFFAGLPLTGPPRALRGPADQPPIAAQLRQLPSSELDVEALQTQASAMLHGMLLSGLPRVRGFAAGWSDLLHIDRVQGIAAAYGYLFPVTSRITARTRLGVGLSDHRVTGMVGVTGPLGAGQWSLSGDRRMQDVSDARVLSPLANTVLAAFGDDHGDWTLVTRSALDLTLPYGASRITLQLGEEWSRSVQTAFEPFRGSSRPNPALGAGAATVARAGISRRDLADNGWTIQLEGGQGDAEWWRVSAAMRARRPIDASHDLRFSVSGGTGSHALPGYRNFVLGGTGTLPGLDYRSLGGRRNALAEVGITFPVSIPTPFVPYARYLRLPSVVMPFVAAGIAGGDQALLPWRGAGRIEPVAGLRLDLWGALLRAETGVSLRHGGWNFGIDIHPDWWPLF